MDTLQIQGTEVVATSPEGQTARMTVEDWMKRVAPARMHTGEGVLPDGVKVVRSRGPATLWFHQSPPRIYNFKWIAEDSQVPFGNGTKYRHVQLALPYLVVMAVFTPAADGKPQLCLSHNEAFFRTAPLRSLDDELLFPALLNCSKFTPAEGRPLSWICTQYLQRSAFDQIQDEGERLHAGLRALLHCLIETGFNYSSEHHEGSSWFNESRRVDPRLATVDAWQAATAQDSLFVMDVPWLPAGLTLRQLAERTFENLHVPSIPFTDASSLARAVFNQAPKTRGRTAAKGIAAFLPPHENL